MTVRAYSRCNSGHYFCGEYCPFDGWSSPASRELTAAVKQLGSLNRDITVKELRNAGVSSATLERTIIIEFGSQHSAFEAMAPEECVVQGEAKPLRELARHFK